MTSSAQASKMVATQKAAAMPCTRMSCACASRDRPGCGSCAAARVAVPNTVISTASPSAPPTCWAAFTMLDAAPASCGATPASETVVSGTKARPTPVPKRSIGPRMPGKYPVAADSPDSQAIPVMTSTRPATIIGAARTRPSTRAASRDTAKSRRVMGRNAAPARSGLKPRTSCRNWVAKKNMPNMPPTSSSRATYDAERWVSANRRSGVTGWAACVSAARNTASATSATARAASVVTSDQPAVAARMKVYTSAAIPVTEVSAPVKSKLPRWRGVSRRKAGAHAATAMPTGTLMKNTQRQDAHRVIRPPRTSPSDAPPLAIPAYRPMARFRPLPSGKDDTIRASEAGDAIAPPTPCRARDAISNPGEVAQAGGQRGQREYRDAGKEDPAAAENVARPPAEQQQAAEGERVGVEHPGQVGGGEVQAGLDAGQGHVHHGHVEDDHQLGAEHDGEGGDWPPATAFGGHRAADSGGGCGHAGPLSHTVGMNRSQPPLTIRRVPPFGNL